MQGQEANQRTQSRQKQQEAQHQISAVQVEQLPENDRREEGEKERRPVDHALGGRTVPVGDRFTDVFHRSGMEQTR